MSNTHASNIFNVTQVVVLRVDSAGLSHKLGHPIGALQDFRIFCLALAYLY